MLFRSKYDWKQLEKEYILSEYNSVSAFLKNKGIKATGNTNKQTKDWKNKKAKKEQEKGNKIIEETIKKESQKEAQQIADIKTIANDLALKVIQASKEANLYINDDGEIQKGLINTKGLKQITSALKDLQDILINNPQSYELKKEKLQLEKQREEKDNW